MTDTNTLAPADAEILDAAEDFRSQYTHGGTTFDEFDEMGFARAVLAKWGQPQAGAGEPVAVIEFTDGVKEPRIMSWNALPAGQHRVYTTPQPTQAQAGAVPLTPKQMESGREAIFSTGNPYCPCDSKTFRKVAEWVERHHGIKQGGQHAD